MKTENEKRKILSEISNDIIAFDLLLYQFQGILVTYNTITQVAGVFKASFEEKTRSKHVKNVSCNKVGLFLLLMNESFHDRSDFQVFQFALHQKEEFYRTMSVTLKNLIPF